MQMSQEEVDRAAVWQHWNTASVLLKDGVQLEKRHYEQYKKSLRENNWIISTPWFGRWIKLHQDNLIRVNLKHPDRRRVRR